MPHSDALQCHPLPLRLSHTDKSADVGGRQYKKPASGAEPSKNTETISAQEIQVLLVEDPTHTTLKNGYRAFLTDTNESHSIAKGANKGLNQAKAYITTLQQDGCMETDDLEGDELEAAEKLDKLTKLSDADLLAFWKALGSTYGDVAKEVKKSKAGTEKSAAPGAGSAAKDKGKNKRVATSDDVDEDVEEGSSTSAARGGKQRGSGSRVIKAPARKRAKTALPASAEESESEPEAQAEQQEDQEDSD